MALMCVPAATSPSAKTGVAEVVAVQMMLGAFEGFGGACGHRHGDAEFGAGFPCERGGTREVLVKDAGFPDRAHGAHGFQLRAGLDSGAENRRFAGLARGLTDRWPRRTPRRSGWR